MGYHFPLPTGGVFTNDSVELSGQATVEALRVFWTVFAALWSDNASLRHRTPHVVGHRHGQKEALGDSVERLDAAINFREAEWMSAAIGVTFRSTEKMTTLASSFYDVTRLLLVPSPSAFLVGGRLDVKNYQSRQSDSLRVGESGDQVVRGVRSAAECGRLGILRTTLYSEGIHLTRARSQSFHDFDYHRWARVVLQLMTPDASPVWQTAVHHNGPEWDRSRRSERCWKARTEDARRDE